MEAHRRRALVIRIGALGDVLLTRRLTYSLSRQGLRSTLFAPARHASLLRADPWIEDVLDSESPRFAGAFRGEWPESDRGFDLAVSISRSDDLARAAGFAATTLIRVDPAPAGNETSIAQQWADAVGPCFTGDLPLLPTSASQAASGETATVIHPGSGSLAKNWPLDRFVELDRRLRDRGHRVIWVLGPAEAELRDAMVGYETLDRAPLETLAASLAQCRLFIGNDSGVSHLAAAVGAPTVSIFGPTNSKVWRPDGPRVEIVISPSGSLEAISVEEVRTACDSVAKLRESGAWSL